MKYQIAKEDNKTRAILYCRSAKGDNTELQEQKVLLDEYVKENKLVVVRTYMESGTMGELTYHNLRLQAKYHEFNELLITELSVLGNSSIEITEEISFLVASGVKVLSLKDGELNVETLPSVFRKCFRLNKNIKAKIY
ncbi:MAG: recombinase family protein [Clostridia bacterium]|nr:recombinase family protein [Clostridia bacterium]